MSPFENSRSSMEPERIRGELIVEKRMIPLSTQQKEDPLEELKEEIPAHLQVPQYVKKHTQMINKVYSWISQKEVFGMFKCHTPVDEKPRKLFEIIDSNSNSKKSNSTPGFLSKATKNVFNFNNNLSIPLMPCVNYDDPKRYIYEFLSDTGYENFKENFTQYYTQYLEHVSPTSKTVKLGRKTIE